MNLIKRTEAGLYSLTKVAAIVASIVLAAMMLLTVADVVGRYFLNRPVTGTWELIGLLMVFAGTWGMGYCQMKKGHISVDVLLERFSHKVQVILRSAAYFIGFISFLLICWQMFLMAKRYFYLTRGAITDTLEIPYYPFMSALAISAGIFALAILVDLLHSLAEVARK